VRPTSFCAGVAEGARADGALPSPGTPGVRERYIASHAQLQAALMTDHKPIAIVAAQAPARTRPSNYPEPFASRLAGREKRPPGELFGLVNFGVNLTRLAPGMCAGFR
jgi:hypothetical protein